AVAHAVPGGTEPGGERRRAVLERAVGQGDAAVVHGHAAGRGERTVARPPAEGVQVAHAATFPGARPRRAARRSAAPASPPGRKSTTSTKHVPSRNIGSDSGTRS